MPLDLELLTQRLGMSRGPAYNASGRRLRLPTLPRTGGTASTNAIAGSVVSVAQPNEDP